MTFSGGIDRITEEISPNVSTQVEKAFDNVEHALQKAGGKGWEQVYKVRIYFAPNWEEAMGKTIELLRKYCPNHQPLLTAVVVHQLYNNMALEIEVEAHLG